MDDFKPFEPAEKNQNSAKNRPRKILLIKDRKESKMKKDVAKTENSERASAPPASNIRSEEPTKGMDKSLSDLAFAHLPGGILNNRLAADLRSHSSTHNMALKNR